MHPEQKEVGKNDSGQALLPPVTLIGESHRNGEKGVGRAFLGLLGFGCARQNRGDGGGVR
jgi:hypothetical protein